jgi:CHAT domain-containing protein/tetratricopeptide (TPR) repeat protein
MTRRQCRVLGGSALRGGAIVLILCAHALAEQAATAQGETFVPPPRTIADITAVLDREKPDPAKVAERKRVADAEPTAGLSGLDLAHFYRDRAAAAGEIGRLQQSVSDSRKALEAVPQGAGPMELLRLREFLANAEASAGRPRAALSLRAEAADQLSASSWGMRVSQPAILATLNSRLGNIEAAQAWLAKADAAGDALAREAKSNPRWRTVGPLWFLDQARGRVLNDIGRYAEAEPYLRRLIRDADALIEDSKTWPLPPAPGSVEGHRIQAIRDLAVNLAQQHRLAEAEFEIRHALAASLKTYGRYHNMTAGLAADFARILTTEGRFAEAEKLERVALDTYLGLGHEPGSTVLSGARADLMSTLVFERRWNDALSEFGQIRTGLAQEPAIRDAIIGTNLVIVIAEIRAGKAQEAAEVARRALERRQSTLGEKHYDTAEARGFYATALAATGDRAGALREYQAAMPILLAASRESVDDERSLAARDFRLNFILEGYIGALVGQQRTATAEEVAEAFRIADAARGRSVQRAIAASAARAAVKDAGLAELVRREQDARQEVAALNGVLASAVGLAPDQQDPKALDALRQRIDQLRATRAATREQIERRFPDYIRLIDPRPATVAEVQAALHPDEALIAIYVADDRSFVWAVPKQGAPAFATASLSRADAEGTVSRLRKALEPNASSLAEIPGFDVAAAYKLYASLLDPVSRGWKGAKSLLVVPHAALGELPLSLLVTAPNAIASEPAGQPPFSAYRKVPWLIRDVAVTQLPTVASLTVLRNTPAASSARRPFVGFADPWFNEREAAEARAERGVAPPLATSEPALAMRAVPVRFRNVPRTETMGSAQLAVLPRLPETAAEVQEVALALKADPVADVFLGERASLQTVKTMKLDDRRVVMFATHGLVPHDLDGLEEPALALTAPRIAQSAGDGLLTMSAVFGLKLDADWVVLSACNTAAGNGAGAEAISGLGLAFFYAGSRALLVSNWPVETHSARALTTDLFRREASDPGLSRAEALRQAELALIDGPGSVLDGRSQFSYAHPIFWAPFAIIGDGGGRHRS